MTKTKTGDWLRLANDDIVVAVDAQQRQIYHLSCFHAQQAAEKLLKGFLAHHERHVRKVHDLKVLLTACAEIDHSCEQLRDDVAYLSKFYIEARYPSDISEFSLEEAKKAHEAASRIREFIHEKLS